MASYEVQSNGPQGWQIVEVFETYDLAYDCLMRADRTGQHFELRLRKEYLDPRTGQIRGATISRAGRKMREEIAKEEKRLEKEALEEQVQKRLHQKLLARWSKREALAKERLRAQTHPLYILFWTSLLFFSGLAALYYLEFVLFQ
jgi:hypothetical protein